MNEQERFNGTTEQRLRRLENWRVTVDIQIDESRRIRERYLPKLDELIDKDNLADAVAQALEKHRTKVFTTGQKLVAGLVAVATLVNVALNVTGFH